MFNWKELRLLFNDPLDHLVIYINVMLTKNKIPFINENASMKNALKIITKKKLGVLIAKNSKGLTTGIITDGTVRRTAKKINDLKNLKVKKIMTKNPKNINEDILIKKTLSIMNSKKITSLCVHNKKNKKKTIGIIHIHNILEKNVH